MDNFTQIPFSLRNLDLFYIRTSVFSAVRETLPQFKGNLLDIGCGRMPYKKYIIENSEVISYLGIDLEGALIYDANIKPDFTWDGKRLPFETNSFDTIISTEVLEHCPEPEVFLYEVFRVLKKGGVFFFTVPFLWNLHEVPHDEFRYTPFSIKRYLTGSGFKETSIKATGGWHASFAQMMGLWVRRAPLKRKPRVLLSYLLKPIINFLIKLDKKHIVSFGEGQMITGLYGIAKK